MAITLQRLCEKANYLYGMRVLAGEKGMDNIVQWVHEVEDVETGSFLHGNELVFTTGIAQQGSDWLVPFARELIKQGASGLVVNSGPYLQGAPRDLVDFCNQQGFPLMDIPWKTRLVDITRDFCNQIIQSDQEEADVGTTFKNLIHYPEEGEKYLPILESHDFDLKGNYRLVEISLEGAADRLSAGLQKTRQQVIRDLYRSRNQAAFFETKDSLFCILENFSEEETLKLVSHVQEHMANQAGEMSFYFVVGPDKCSLTNLSTAYRRTTATMQMARKTQNHLLCYDDLGLNKILISVDDPEILREYYQDTLGRLEAHDRDNGTSYLTLLHRYLVNDGSVQKVAEELFVHRNTINYQLGKIRKILDMDFSGMEERFRLMMAFQIRDIL